jgi:cubilin
MIVQAVDTWSYNLIFCSIFSDWEIFIHDSPFGYLTSPYYPSFYLNNKKRLWKIKVPEGQRIRLDMLYLNIKSDRQCNRDSVIVRESTDSRTVNALYCGNTLPSSYSSSGNVVYVEFQSDQSNVGTGFKMRYQALSCKLFLIRPTTEC